MHAMLSWHEMSDNGNVRHPEMHRSASKPYITKWLQLNMMLGVASGVCGRCTATGVVSNSLGMVSCFPQSRTSSGAQK